METGFLNKHDNEYFSTDGYEQSNGFESENSLFNVFTVDYNDRSGEWIIPDEISQADKPKEDFRKTFEDWQQHISYLQSRDESLKEQLLCSPLPDDIPDIFGTSLPISTDKIKTEPYNEEDNLISFANNEIIIKQEQADIEEPNLNTNISNELAIKKSIIRLDNNTYKKGTNVRNNKIKEKLEKHILNTKIKIEKENDIFFENSSLIQEDMPVLSPVEGIIVPVLDRYMAMHPPKLEMSGNRKMEQIETKFYTNDLGPDNYDVVEIKVEQDDGDEQSRIEVTEDSKPVIEASTLDTLLEQFEASEVIARNNFTTDYKPEIYRCPEFNNKQSTTQNNKIIQDSLKRVVIDRIKDSPSKKKGISVVPAARLPAKGFNHMKDAGATKNKLSKLKINKLDETVKLDHYYCHSVGVNSNNTERLSAGNSTPYSDNSSKKDSGLESGDISDCSSEPSSSLVIGAATTSLTSSAKSLPRTSVNKDPSSLRSAVHIKPGESLLIKNQKIDNNNKTVVGEVEVVATSLENTTVPNSSIDNIKEEENGEEQKKKKKKLNLEEYRSRRKNFKNKPVSPTKSFNKGELNGFSEKPDSTQTADKNTPSSMIISEPQTQLAEDKKESKKRDSSNDRSRSSRPWQRYRRRSISSSSSSSDSRSRSRWRRERSRRRRYSKGRSARSRTRTRSRSRSKSRSRSPSPSSLHSLSSSSSLSRSRSRSGSSKYHYRSRNSYRRSRYNRPSRYSQDRTFPSRRQEDWSSVEKMRQIEERRVIYVGQIEEGTTKSQLRERFETFGPIIDISLHFRERRDNYGFVTFAYKGDAYRAVEHGNDYPLQPRYDICFGGRRAFCKQRYSDLDGITQAYSPYHQNTRSNDSFDVLLREAQEKIRKQKHL